jgi:hypothetical protein
VGEIKALRSGSGVGVSYRALIMMMAAFGNEGTAARV